MGIGARIEQCMPNVEIKYEEFIAIIRIDWAWELGLGNVCPKGRQNMRT